MLLKDTLRIIDEFLSSSVCDPDFFIAFIKLASIKKSLGLDLSFLQDQFIDNLSEFSLEQIKDGFDLFNLNIDFVYDKIIKSEKHRNVIPLLRYLSNDEDMFFRIFIRFKQNPNSNWVLYKSILYAVYDKRESILKTFLFKFDKDLDPFFTFFANNCSHVMLNARNQFKEDIMFAYHVANLDPKIKICFARNFSETASLFVISHLPQEVVENLSGSILYKRLKSASFQPYHTTIIGMHPRLKRCRNFL